MAQEQLGQVLGILAIVLGATDDEGFAELLQGDRVDGVESDPGVGLQEEDQAQGRLFQANAYPSLRMLLAQLQEPVMQSFWRGADSLLLGFARGVVNEIKIGLFIGTIQANDQIEGMWGVHHGWLVLVLV
jgi:ATP-dependent helicase YprA (DUF1998 family)